MIKKLILSTTITIALAHGSADKILPTDSNLTTNEKTKYAAFNPTLGKKESGESCKEGNCIKDMNCLTKEGKGYRLFTSIRSKLKREFKRL